MTWLGGILLVRTHEEGGEGGPQKRTKAYGGEGGGLSGKRTYAFFNR